MGYHSSTIVAQATPPGRGSIGIVRLSGSESLSIAQKITGKSSIKVRKAYFSSFFDHHMNLIDQGILIYFKAPYSFTGEDIIEFQCHGSPWVMDQIIKQTLVHGAVLAKPGEFSERAFLNDKIDLTQAEAIADLIAAQSNQAARLAMQSLKGEFSKQIAELATELLKLRLFIEASIDFSEEELDPLTHDYITQQLTRIVHQFEEIYQAALQGLILQEERTAVIVGLPNAGKSSLINFLAKEDLAIVTDVPGTTRDLIKNSILIEGIPIQLIDTAGLRESSCLVEQEGIQRAWQEIAMADCILLVIDLNGFNEQKQAIEDVLKAIQAAVIKDVPIIRIFNQIDRMKQEPRTEGSDVYISVKFQLGMNFLTQKMLDVFSSSVAEGKFLARRRHIDILDKVLSYIQMAIKADALGMGKELIADDLRFAHQSLGEITGECTSDDLLGEIFSHFCIGK